MKRQFESAVCGVVAVDKPQGMTSHDVVNRVRRLFHTKRVGHTGTLDPLATGVLVLCLGQATRIVEYLTADRKRYTAGVRFGVSTNSQDITGQETSRIDSSHLAVDDVRSILPQFTGLIQQVPPMVSAVHHEGKRLYELARQGIEVERAARTVEIHNLELIDFAPGPEAFATLDVECSSGTYIRTLASDIGEALGTGACMESLRRTRTGASTLADCVTLDELSVRAEQGTLDSCLTPIAAALGSWPRYTMSEAELVDIRHGRSISAEALGCDGQPLLLLDESGAAMAIARAAGGRLAPEKVLGE